MSNRSIRRLLRPIGALVFISLVLTGARNPAAADDAAPPGLPQIRHQIDLLKNDQAAQQDRAQKDELQLKKLELELQKLQSQNAKIDEATRGLAVSGANLQTQTAQQLQDLQQRLAAGIAPDNFNQAMSRYLGQHQFSLNGAAAASFIYDRRTASNTFSLAFEPIILYRLNDWILFEGTVQGTLPRGADAQFELPVATAQIFLNDYLEINAGIFDQPFGDFYEDQSPLWVNRFVTAPLLYGAQPIVPPTDIGIQLRGSVQWGALGQDVDYTTWVANGPSFDPALPVPVVGQTLAGQNNIGLNTNGRAFGTRVRVYPLPFDSNWGRLELGASTYNGKWLNSHWFNAWGVDFAYLKRDLQARGEFAGTFRQVPLSSGAGAGADDRQGWYVQAGYFLQDLPVSALGERLADTIHHLELLVRYSGVNQPAVVSEEIQNTPALGFSGSPSIFAPHAREVALGVDYWIAPSIVWQNELDLEMPGTGGRQIAFTRATPMASPFRSALNDQAVLTQIAIGF